jgi:hypothetical protein
MPRFRSRQISLYDDMADVYDDYSILAWGAVQLYSRYRGVFGICCFRLEGRIVTCAGEGSCRQTAPEIDTFWDAYCCLCVCWKSDLAVITNKARRWQ